MIQHLIITESYHLAIAMALAFIFKKELGFKISIFYSLSFGFFTDVDHFFDYFLYLTTYSDKFSIADFFLGKHFEVSHRFYVPFHSWELVMLLLIIYFYLVKLNIRTAKPYKLHTIFLLAGFALFGHLMMDQITNRVGPLDYFFTYRYLTDFLLY